MVPVIDEVVSLADAGKAIQKMENSSQFGKIVISV
jgi:zinc-binding alcohol dehydrogenase/oxidoreductase